MEKGATLNNLNKYEEAIKSFNMALEIRPSLAIAWYNKGSALVAIGEYEEAMKSFDTGIAINPNDPKAWYHKGAALVNDMKKYKESLQRNLYRLIRIFLVHGLIGGSAC